MPELERMLTQLGRELDWPDTPDLAGVLPPAQLRRGGGPAGELLRARASASAVVIDMACHPDEE